MARLKAVRPGLPSSALIPAVGWPGVIPGLGANGLLPVNWKSTQVVRPAG